MNHFEELNQTNSEAKLSVPPHPVEIPTLSLSLEALSAVIQAYVLREGTDYGIREFSHEEKIKDVRLQLERKKIILVFDPTTESVTFMNIEDFKRAVSEPI